MIRVLVADDSALMRNIISDMLSSDPEITVVGTAMNGEFAVKKVRELKPDVVTMDIEMPVMDGIAALKEIMSQTPVPVIMISAHTPSGSTRTIEAMSAGAVDFILKPSGEISTNISILKDELIAKIKSATRAKIFKFRKEESAPKKQFFNPTRKKIIVIGSSTGGPQTLEALLTEIPGNIPAPILIVQHMPPIFTKSLAERLDKICQIRVREAKDGDELQNGVALIAPGGFHMELKADHLGFEGTIRMNTEPPELGVRPNVNRLFKSVADIFHENTIGVVLTGMGTDGTEGSRVIKSFHGTVIAESEKTSIIYGMPKSVVDAGLADEVLNLDDIAVALVQLLEI